MTRRRDKQTEYLIDDTRSLASLTREERGVLALWQGLDTYTRNCAPLYADPCAAIEFGVVDLFATARGMLNYAPDTLRRGALSSSFGEMLAEWHIDPDTLEWTGE